MKNYDSLYLTVAFCIMAIFSICLADVTVIYPTDDSYIDERYPGTYHGSDFAMLAGPAGNDNDCVVFIKFPIQQGSIPGIPTGSIITNVLLKLYIFVPSSDFPTLRAYRATMNWNEETLTTPGWSMWGPLVTGVVHYATPYNNFHFEGTQMTAEVNSWYSGTMPNNGFAVRSDYDQGSIVNLVTFFTKEVTFPTGVSPALTIFYNPQPPHLTWDPTSNDFDTIEVGQSSPPFTFTLTNDGGQAVTGDITTTGLNPGSFPIISGGGSFILDVGESQDVVVKFQPASAEPKSAFLHASGANAPNAEMTGVGVPPQIPHLTWIQTSHDFDTIEVGQSSPPFTFTLTNDGGQAVTGDITTTGLNPGSFPIISGGGSFILNPGETWSVDVEFQPTSAGLKSAFLHASGANAPNAEMTGFGFQLANFAYTADTTEKQGSINVTTEFFSYVRNWEQNQITYRVFINRSLCPPFPDWSVSFCFGTNCFSPFLEETTYVAQPNGIDTVGVIITPANSVNDGWVTMTVQPEGVPGLAQSIVFHLWQFVGVHGKDANPQSYTLLQTYPNPFNGALNLDFSLKTPGEANLSVYDLQGNRVAEVFQGHAARGEHRYTWNPENLASGIYLTRLEAEGVQQVKKVVYLR